MLRNLIPAHHQQKAIKKKFNNVEVSPKSRLTCRTAMFLASYLQDFKSDLKNNLMHAPYAQKELHILPESCKERASFGRPSIVLDVQKISLSGTRFCGPQCHRGERKNLCLPSPVQGSPCNAASYEGESVISPAGLLDVIYS
jgi:hypothetical protein